MAGKRPSYPGNKPSKTEGKKSGRLRTNNNPKPSRQGPERGQKANKRFTQEGLRIKR